MAKKRKQQRRIQPARQVKPEEIMTWQEYQEAVGRFYENLEDIGDVQRNVFLPDLQTGQARQIDLLLQFSVRGHAIRIVIDAKYRKSKLDVKDIEEVQALAAAVGANKAAIVCANGWTQPAGIKAQVQSLDLRLLPVEEAAEILQSWSVIWDSRVTGLESLLGPSGDRVFHAIISIARSTEVGSSDVLEFKMPGEGRRYVTADLTGVAKRHQIPSRVLGHYEVMICTRKPSRWAAEFVAGMGARATTWDELNPYETMGMYDDITGEDLSMFAKGIPLHAMVLCESDTSPRHFFALGRKYGLLLYVGIFASELAFARSAGVAELVELLKKHAVYPYTDYGRTPVV